MGRCSKRWYITAAAFIAAAALAALAWAFLRPGPGPAEWSAGIVHMDLGITYLTVTPGMTPVNDEKSRGGVLVTEVVPGGPAARGGLEAGDVILSFNGRALDGDRTLLSLLADCPEGEPMTLEILRQGCDTTVEVPGD